MAQGASVRWHFVTQVAGAIAFFGKTKAQPKQFSGFGWEQTPDGLILRPPQIRWSERGNLCWKEKVNLGATKGVDSGVDHFGQLNFWERPNLLGSGRPDSEKKKWLSKGIWNIEFEICGSEVVESIWPRSVAPLHDQHDSCGPWWGRTKNLWNYVRAGRLMQTAIIANFKHILCMRVFTCCLGSLFFLNAVLGNVDCAQFWQTYDTCFPSWKQFLVAHVLDQHKQTKCEELSGRQSDKSRLNIGAPPPVLFWVCFNNQMLP